MLLEGSVGDTAEEISRLLRIPPGSNSARKELQTLLYDLNVTFKDCTRMMA